MMTPAIYSTIYEKENIDTIVTLLQQYMREFSLFTFRASLGGGKTTLVSHLLQACGVNSPITSPTFTYLNIYQGEFNKNIAYFYHFDLYRLEDDNQFFLLGFEEYLYQPNSWIFIEWPEVIISYLSHPYCEITLEYIDETRREIKIIKKNNTNFNKK